MTNGLVYGVLVPWNIKEEGSATPLLWYQNQSSQTNLQMNPKMVGT